MADAKISALPASTTPLAGTEVLPIVQSGATKQVSVANLTNGRDIATKNITASGRVQITFDGSAGAPALDMRNSNGTQWETYTPTSDNSFNLDVWVPGQRDKALKISNAAGSHIFTLPTYGAGAATFSATGVISSVSDETWKIKDGVPQDPDAMLKKLEPGYWFYNDEKKEIFGSERQLGFYAQNVHSAIGEEAAPTPPEIINTDGEGNTSNSGKYRPWGYYDRSVLAVAVMSLKNALTKIENLEARLSILENK